ncbi:MAG: TonB-dependent receptor plug domain-containing protein [Gemmatimonadaceae bacterium]
MNSLLRVKWAQWALVGLVSACAASPSRPSSSTANAPIRANEPVEITLQKKVPGLIVTRNADGVIALQPRTSSAFNGNETPPIFMLNGLAFQPGEGGALVGIIPEDIASIKFLRGASAALYGIQGANGVVEITTKLAGKREF